ncbi:hypothetical protein CWO07_22730 [Vibrio splendidus]|uniref:Uncharacterized protein n=1 Tax=Vibrio splendidus TaxID=29497 RepID=A0A2T5EPT6_VIBSP|nr:hypothetical protein [Vibrio splendidus]PTP23814.1 hypothetical protein CWO07_22730 [Vibrio splendidus]
MTFSPTRKGTVLIPTGPVKHLHFICNDPVYHAGLDRECVLVVNITTADDDEDYDKTCILDVGDHPFVKHKSYVFYKESEILVADNITRNVAEGNFAVHDPCSDIAFKRVVDGFDISDEVRIKIHRFYEKHVK